MGKKQRSPKLQAQRKEASKRYHEKIDRIVIYVPGGQKPTVEAAAIANGESVNAFINKAMLSRMGLAEWPKREEQP